jgi:hypothetical protein
MHWYFAAVQIVKCTTLTTAHTHTHTHTQTKRQVNVYLRHAMYEEKIHQEGFTLEDT